MIVNLLILFVTFVALACGQAPHVLAVASGVGLAWLICRAILSIGRP